MRWRGLLGDGEPAMRKVNYALYVKRTMPLRDRGARLNCLIMEILAVYSVNFMVDIQGVEAYLYLRITEAVHGEAETTGSEERGAGAGRHSQSQPRSRSRRSVHRQSILRCQGPGPGALRDGAAPSDRRHCNQRSCRGVRRHPADLLQSPERITGWWARRSVAKPARSQNRPQGLRRGHCLRDRSPSGKARGDDLAVCRRNRVTLRHQGAQAQPGAGAGAQKKTNPSSLIAAPADTAATYEKVRAAVLSAEATTSSGLGILRRQGLAAWMRALRQEPHADAACLDPQPPPSAEPDLSPSASDVTRLIAGILISLAMEPLHA